VVGHGDHYDLVVIGDEHDVIGKALQDDSADFAISASDPRADGDAGDEVGESRFDFGLELFPQARALRLVPLGGVEELFCASGCVRSRLLKAP
jgi:hypothetical protein